ncbi:MAG: hypothetical protein ABI860_11825, partial [Gemmatimonadales bacterium]
MSALIAWLLGARRRAERAAARTAHLHALNAAPAPPLTPDEASAIIIRHAMQALHARAGALAMARPKFRVLFMSDYTDDDVVRRGLLRPGSPF